MENVLSLKTLFEDPPELHLIKGGRWNQAQNYLNILLFLSASILLVKQESEPVIVCFSSVGNESMSLGSNYAFMEEECEGQAVDTWYGEIFHMYLGWFFTVQIIAIIIWGRIWIGGNRKLLEMCATFGRIVDAITNVSEDESSKHCIDQNYLQRANRVFFHGLRTSHNILYSKIWWVSGASVFTLIFSVINIGILGVTQAYHQESIECQYSSNLSVTCQFTSFDFVFSLACIFTGVFLLELFCLILEGVSWIKFKSDLIDDIYTKFERPKLTNITDLDEEEAKLEAEKNAAIVDAIPPELFDFQCTLQAQERCDLCFLMKSLEMNHGKPMGLLFLSIMDEKVKLGWTLTENKKFKKDGVLKLSKIYQSFYSQNVSSLKLISPNAPQILFTTAPESDDWEMVAGLTTQWLEWSDWENDTIKISVDSAKEVTTRITWNKRVILEDTFQSDSSKNGLISKTKVMNGTGNGDDKTHLVKIMKSEGKILSTLKIDDKTNLFKPMKTMKKKNVFGEDVPELVLMNGDDKSNLVMKFAGAIPSTLNSHEDVPEYFKEEIPNTIIEMDEVEKQTLI